MSISLYIPIASVDEFIGTGSNQFDSIKLYRAVSRGGTYSLVTTITLVAGDTVYTYTDTTGVSTSWYKITYYNSITLDETSLTETEPFPATRDLLTRKELRQKIVLNLSGKVLTPSAYTVATAVSDALVDTAADSAYYTGWQLYRPNASSSADYNRRVSAYSGSTGTLTHGGTNYADTNVTGEQIEILPVDIDYTMLLEKINDGLEDTRWLYRLELGMISGQNQYKLPWFVEGEEYVKQIWRRFGGTANSYIWRPIGLYTPWAKVRGSNFQCTLDVDPSIGDNEVLALEVWRPGERLDSETDFTYVHQRWAEAASMCAIIEFLIDQELLRHAQTALIPLLQKWQIRLRKCARKYGPTPMMKIQPMARMRGLAEI